MSVQKKTHNKKKKKDKPSKSKLTTGSKPHSKHKDAKGKKHRKHSKGHVTKGAKKKKSKTDCANLDDDGLEEKDLRDISDFIKRKNLTSKPKIPTTEPAEGPFTGVPPKKKKKEKKDKKSIEKREEPEKVKVVTVDQPIGVGSGSMKLEKTQASDDSIQRKKEKEEKKKAKEEEKKKEMKKKEMEEKLKTKDVNDEKKEKKDDDKKEKEPKKKKESDKKEKEPKIRPVPPGSSKKTSSSSPEQKVSGLYNIVGETSDTKSSLENNTPVATQKKKSDPKVVTTPDAKTPETEGPPMMEEKKKKGEGSKKDGKPKEEPKEGTGYMDEMKLESDRDNLDEKPVDVKKTSSGSKTKLKSESLKLKKTQSLSPVNFAAPIPPGPPGKQIVKPDSDPNNELIMKTPPINDDSNRVKIVEPQRSEIEQPHQEPEFVQLHGDTRAKRMDMKKVDLDLIGRTGMYLERFGMSGERKAAFDWIAYNRHDMNGKQQEFSQNMAVALSDIGINKELLMRTVVYLKSHGQISPSEMDKVLQVIKGMKGDVVSFSQTANILKNNCEAYKIKLSKEKEAA